MAAAGVDGLVLAPVVGAIAFEVSTRENPIVLFALGALLFTVLSYQLLLTVETGQTLGKRATGIEIVRIDRAALEGPVVFARMWLPLLVSGAPFFAIALYAVFVGFISAVAPGIENWVNERPITIWSIWYTIIAEAVRAATLFLPDARTWYDRLLGTEVVESRGARRPVKHGKLLAVSFAVAVMHVVGAFVICFVGLLFFFFNSYFHVVGPRAR